MARYTGPREKIERRLGTKLFLKGERSYSNKSATVKRPYPPGAHGKRFSNRVSEFGQQLRSKQKVRQTYRMLEKQFSNLVKAAIQAKGETGGMIVSSLEKRLDNVIYRLGIGQSRDQARQIVNHGHIVVNGKKISIPSYAVRFGDVITIRPASAKSKFFSALMSQWIKKTQAPKWLDFNKDTLSAKVAQLPTFEDAGLEIKDIQSIIEFYSR